MEMLEFVIDMFPYIGTLVGGLGAAYAAFAPKLKRVTLALVEAGQAFVEISQLLDDVVDAVEDENITDEEVKEIAAQAKIAKKEFDELMALF